MFVFSIKTSKRRLIPILLGASVIAAMVIALLCFPATRTMVTSTTAGANDEQCAAYLRTLGYEASLPAAAVEEIRLPDRFDEALAAYNALQNSVGFDLTGYAGQRVKLRTYSLSEHPSGAGACAHLYVYDGRIVGGDITAADGTVAALCRDPDASC